MSEWARVRTIGDRVYISLGNVEHGMSEIEVEMLLLAPWRELKPAEMLASLRRPTTTGAVRAGETP